MADRRLRARLCRRRPGSISAALLLLATAAAVSAQTIPEMEFRDEPVSTILLVLGHAVGKTVLADATVTGSASYYFRNRDFDEALAAFAESQDLFVETRDDTVHVSRVRLRRDADGLISIEARDVPLRTIVEHVDQATPVAITHNGLDGRRVSIHAEALTPRELLDALIAPISGIEVRATDAGYALRPRSRTALSGADTGAGQRVVEIAEREGRYDIAVQQADLVPVLRELFESAGADYLDLHRGNPRIRELRLTGASLEEAVEALALAADAQAVWSAGRWVLLDGGRGAAEALATTVRLHLEHAGAQSALDALPPEMVHGLTVSVVPGENALRVTGYAARLEPLLTLMRMIDRPPSGVSYHRHDLVYADAGEVLQSLPRELTRSGAVVLDRANAILLLSTPSQADRVSALVSAMDVAPAARPIRLKHRTGDELFDSLPSSIPRRYLRKTAEPGLLLFTGPPDVGRHLNELLRAIDVVEPQIRYDLFIVQYQEGKSIDYRLAIESIELEPMDTAVILGRLGDLLSVSADIVSLFGHKFALSLSSALGNNEAQVLADTSVTAVSGTPVSFRNTETYRYRDLPVAADSQESAVGVTREITSGLFIDIDGAVTESGEIALTISATVSKRGHEVGEATGNPPATAERVVSSSLRAQSGEPVVVGSFLLRDRSKSVRKVPFLGDIPLLGWLFRGVRSTVEESELVVYLVPHVLTEGEPKSPEALLRTMAEAAGE